MQPDVARAHVATLNEWADIWEYDGDLEVMFQLRRAARAIGRTLGDVPFEEPEVVHPLPEDVTEPRLDTKT